MTPLPPKSMPYRSINRQVGQAIHRYEMIAGGDRILVGMSGGKDSLTLMWTLSERLRRVPVDYELIAVYIDPGFEGGFGKDLAAYCRQAGYDFRWERNDFGPRAHGTDNRENPCFLCPRLVASAGERRGSTAGGDSPATGRRSGEAARSRPARRQQSGVDGAGCDRLPAKSSHLRSLPSVFDLYRRSGRSRRVFPGGENETGAADGSSRHRRGSS